MDPVVHQENANRSAIGTRAKRDGTNLITLIVSQVNCLRFHRLYYKHNRNVLFIIHLFIMLIVYDTKSTELETVLFTKKEVVDYRICPKCTDIDREESLYYTFCPYDGSKLVDHMKTEMEPVDSLSRYKYSLSLRHRPCICSYNTLWLEHVLVIATLNNRCTHRDVQQVIADFRDTMQREHNYTCDDARVLFFSSRE